MHAGKIKVLAVNRRQRAPSAPRRPDGERGRIPEPGNGKPSAASSVPAGMPLAVREQIAADVRAAVASDPSIEGS